MTGNQAILVWFFKFKQQRQIQLGKYLHPQPVSWKELATSVPELQMFEAGFDEESKIDGIGPLHSTFLKRDLFTICSQF